MRRPDPRRVRDLLRMRHWSALRVELENVPSMDIADLLMEQPAEERIFLLKLLARERAAEVLSHVEAPQRERLLEELTPAETLRLLADMPTDEQVRLLAELPPGEAAVLLDGMPAPQRAEVRTLLSFPASSVGRQVDTSCIRLRPDWSAARGLAEARVQATRCGMANVLFVTGIDGRLLGSLRLRTLILADPADTISALMEAPVVTLSAHDSCRAAVRQAQHYDADALPVVDADDHLLGIVTVDDLMDLAESHVTEDLHHLGGMGFVPVRLHRASMSLLYRKRVGWLLALVALSVAASGVLYQLAPTLQAAVFLVTFLPLVIDCGGNAGAQTAMLTVRALAQGDVEMRHWRGLLWRELRVAAALGASVAVAAGLLGLWRVDPAVGLVVGLTVLVVIVIGSLIGLLLPLLLNRLGLDPATASTPLVTSLADLGGILVYFGLVAALLGAPD